MTLMLPLLLLLSEASSSSSSASSTGLCQNSSLLQGWHWPADTASVGNAATPSALACAEALLRPG